MKNLGFGMMRLPVIGCDPTNFDYEHLNAMVDEFLAAGYTYFDTSFVSQRKKRGGYPESSCRASSQGQLYSSNEIPDFSDDSGRKD